MSNVFRLKDFDASLVADGIAILPPAEARQTLEKLASLGVQVQTTILDPWYNKGIGGTRNDYDAFILELLSLAADVSQHVFLWGFPEIIARFVERIPPSLVLVAWLTWYYKNSPSVIRGWRSSQNACLHLSQPGAKLFPEHFLNEAQKAKLAEGKLRYMPGPTSVIEESLLCGFVGKNEQMGHPAQKPVAVFERIILMTTKQNDLVLDPMCGAGTTGEAARRLERRAILCDESEEYTKMSEERLGVTRLGIKKSKAKDYPNQNRHREPAIAGGLFRTSQKITP
jgi:site-specific DNA-methyltransferase (adenine-specific)